MTLMNQPTETPTLITSAQAAGLGLTRRKLQGPAYRPVVRGVHAPSTIQLTTRLRAEAVLLIAPLGTVIARHTAAQLWGGIVPHSSDIHVMIPHGTQLTRVGVRASRFRVMPNHTRSRTIPITTPERTFLDLAAYLDLVDLVVLGDSLVRRGVTDVDALTEAAIAYRGRGARLARRSAALVRPEVDSPMETRVRLLLLMAGLPEPIINYLIFDDSGTCVYRLDLAFPAIKLAIEYDGRQHAESTRQWTSDVARREQLESWGWRLVVVLSGDVFADPATFLRRIVEIMTERGMPARVTDSTWERHFPVRRAA